MNADTHELKTILTLEKRYIIPTFQRDYEWTRDGQWALLFEDLEAVANRLEDARRIATATGQSTAKAESCRPSLPRCYRARPATYFSRELGYASRHRRSATAYNVATPCSGYPRCSD